MKKILFFFFVAMFFACKNNDTSNKFVVEGFVKDSAFNGHKIYLVAMDEKTFGVDSTFVKDNKFSFTRDKEYIADIRFGKYSFELRKTHFVQNLLVVTEPGVLQVEISENSSAKGTPQNEFLQKWKELTVKSNELRAPYIEKVHAAIRSGIEENEIKPRQELDSVLAIYYTDSYNMLKTLDSCTVKDFLLKMIPKKYQND